MMRLWLVNDSKRIDILPLVSNLTWTENIDTLGVQLTFDVIYSDAQYIPDIEIAAGDHILLNEGDKNVFTGIIVTENYSGRNPISYTAMDYGFYLNKSEGIYQFNCTSDVAIKKILEEFNIKHAIEPMRTIIKQIYLDRVISDTIKDILKRSTEQTGISYNMEMQEDALSIVPFNNLILDIMYTIVSNPTRSRSITEMKNSIIMYTGNEDYNKVLVKEQNEAYIKQYGLLQHVENVDDSNIARARNIAKNLLADLGKVAEDSGCTVFGDIRLKAGRIIPITEPVTGLEGKYLIKSCTHQYGTQYTTDLVLKRWDNE